MNNIPVFYSGRAPPHKNLGTLNTVYSQLIYLTISLACNIQAEDDKIDNKYLEYLKRNVTN
jgi:hypothetical protein